MSIETLSNFFDDMSRNNLFIFSKYLRISSFFSQIGGDNVSMDILSMGMSSDYYEAILEGANMVRIGSALLEIGYINNLEVQIWLVL